MAYGRLDVFFPDGTFKTFPLSTPNTSLGRASSNTISLDSSSIARKHAEIHYADGQAEIVDANDSGGSFVDGVKLNAGQPRALFGGEEIQLGNLRIVYHFYDDTPTRPIIVPEETTQHVEIAAPDFTVDVIGPDQPVAPGAHIAAQIIISNTSASKQRYEIEISGLPRDWVRLDHSEIEVAPGKSGEAILNFKPARRPESTPGIYRVLITARSALTPDAAAKCEVLLEVLPFSGFGIALEEAHVNAGERFKLYLHNQGSSALNLALAARDLENKLRFNLPNPAVALGPGQRVVITGTAHGRSLKLWGGAQEHPFDLVIRARNAAGFTTAVRGYVNVKPSLPVWTPLILIAGLAAVAMIAIFLLGTVLSTAKPVINTFNTSTARVTQGNPLTLTWDIEDADSLRVLVNGNVLLDNVDPAPGRLDIDTHNTAGVVLFTLQARNSAGEAEASQVVEISEPILVNYFTVDPPQLVRYVVQSVTINWSVKGAVTTRLSGLEVFAPSQILERYGASGTVQVVGIPLEPLVLRLTAQDAEGTTIEQVLTIDVIEPRCLPSGTDITLYSAPDASAQVIGTVPTETAVTVDAQDASGLWLRVLLAGNSQGWGARNLFVCENTFDPGQLQKAVQLPPTATPTSAIPQSTTAPATATPLTPIAPTATGRLGG
ncbi:MAG: FHA domain-containing protein [Anaerolineae bacterium]|nr:FHA domain-containing protein [Anaerolineae bacterium]